MHLGRLLIAAAALVAATAASAETAVKIGVLNDRSGLYADISGEGSVVAAKLAIEDFKAADKGLKVDVVSADHQNKPDVAINTGREWFDQQGVDLIIDVPNSGIALALSELVKEKNKVFINSGAGASDLTGAKCSPNTVHWTYDTWALAHGTGNTIVKRGGTTWFFITADYAFGAALERDTAQVVKDSGGTVLGSVKAPLSTQDFSSFLLQAQSSGAKIVGLANAGGDTINSIKQAAEFGIVQGGQNLAGLLIFITRHSFAWPQDGTRPDFHGRVLLGSQRRDAGLVGPIHESDRAAAKHGPSRGLFRRAALPEGGGSPEERQGWQGCRRQDEGDANRRSALREGRGPRRWPQDPRHVSVRGQKAGGIEGSMGLLQASCDHSRRQGV